MNTGRSGRHPGREDRQGRRQYCQHAPMGIFSHFILKSLRQKFIKTLQEGNMPLSAILFAIIMKEEKDMVVFMIGGGRGSSFSGGGSTCAASRDGPSPLPSPQAVEINKAGVNSFGNTNCATRETTNGIHASLKRMQNSSPWVAVLIACLIVAGVFASCEKGCNLQEKEGYNIVGEGKDCYYEPIKKDSIPVDPGVECPGCGHLQGQCTPACATNCTNTACCKTVDPNKEEITFNISTAAGLISDIAPIETALNDAKYQAVNVNIKGDLLFNAAEFNSFFAALGKLQLIAAHQKLILTGVNQYKVGAWGVYQITEYQLNEMEAFVADQFMSFAPKNLQNHLTIPTFDNGIQNMSILNIVEPTAIIVSVEIDADALISKLLQKNHNISGTGEWKNVTNRVFDEMGPVPSFGYTGINQPLDPKIKTNYPGVPGIGNKKLNVQGIPDITDVVLDTLYVDNGNRNVHWCLAAIKAKYPECEDVWTPPPNDIERRIKLVPVNKTGPIVIKPPSVQLVYNNIAYDIISTELLNTVASVRIFVRGPIFKIDNNTKPYIIYLSQRSLSRYFNNTKPTHINTVLNEIKLSFNLSFTNTANVLVAFYDDELPQNQQVAKCSELVQAEPDVRSIW